MLEQEKISRIRSLLKAHTRGMTISAISAQLKMNRNSLAKYLEILQISGQVECRTYGTARVFCLSHRVPISSMLNASLDIVIAFDEAHKVVYANDHFLSFFSLAREAVVGGHVIELRSTGITNTTLPEIFSGPIIDQERVAEVWLEKDGKEFWFKVKSIRTVFDDGRNGITVIMEDVTLAKKTASELAANEARYRAIVEDQTEFITRFSGDGSLTFANASYARYLGKNSEDLIGRYHIPVFCGHDITMLNEAIASLGPDRPFATVECRISNPSGRVCWNSWTLRAIFDESGTIREYQGVGHDSSLEKDSAEKLDVHIARMEFFSRKLQEFLELPPDADVYGSIGSSLGELLPGALIVVTAYDQATCSLTVKTAIGVMDREFIAKHLGTDLVGMSIRTRPAVIKKIFSRKLYQIRNGLLHIQTGLDNAEAFARIEKYLGLKEYYTLGLVWQDSLLGSITIGLREGNALPDPILIETYAQAASIALKRQKAEEALTDSECRRAEEALKASEIYQKILFDSAPAGIVVIDPKNQTIFDANLTAVEMIGADKSLITGTSCRKYFADCVEDGCTFTDLGGEISRSESFLNADDGLKPVIRTIAPIILGNKSYLLESFVDISERKKAEDALRVSEKRFHDLADMLPQNVYETDSMGKVTFANRCSYAMYGYSPEDVRKGLYVWQLIHPDDRDRVMGDFVAALTKKASEFPGQHEFTALRKDGSTFPLLTYHLPVVNDNRITGMRGIGIDLTEITRAKKALEESEKRFRDLVEMIPSNFCENDISGRVTFANSYGLKKYGYTVDDVERGVYLADLIHPNDRARMMQEFVNHISKKPLEFGEHCIADRYEFTALRKDGTTFPNMIFALPIFSGDQVIGAASVGFDLTEQKEAEDAIRENGKYLQFLVENLPFGIVHSDSVSGAIRSFSGGFTKITGYDPCEAGQDMNELLKKMFPDPDFRCAVIESWAEDLRQFRGTGTTTDRTFRVRCGEGTDKDVRFRVVYFEDGTELMTIEDATCVNTTGMTGNPCSINNKPGGRSPPGQAAWPTNI